MTAIGTGIDAGNAGNADTFDFKKMIGKVIGREDLTAQEAEQAITAIMSGQLTEAQIAAFLIAERMKGESVAELAAFAKVMREFAIRKKLGFEVFDTCGTGGDKIKTFNVSTAVAFVLASTGVKVAKHGNRAITSKAGSADVLEALGANLGLDAGQVEKCIRETGIGFMFAPNFHPAMKYAGKVRKELGTRTFFNLLGPLTNPFGAKRQIIGVFNKEYAEKMAQVLARLGCEKGFVLFGEDGLDEASTLGKTVVYEILNGKVKESACMPGDFGLKKAGAAEIAGGNAEENARIIREIFSGKETGPKRDIVLLNAGFAFVAAGKARTVKEGIGLAAEEMDRGRVLKKLEEFVACTKSF